MSGLKLACLNLTRHRVSSILALLLLALSIGCSGLLLRLYMMSNNRYSSIGRGGDAVIGAKAGGIEILLNSLFLDGEYPDFIPSVLYQTLKGNSTVKFSDGAQFIPSYIKAVIPIVFFGKLKNYRVIGTDPTFLNRPNTEDSLTIREGKWPEKPDEVAVGSHVALSEKLHIGDSVEVHRWIGIENDNELFSVKVSAILDPTDSVFDSALYGTVSKAHEILSISQIESKTPWKSDVFHYFFVYLADGGQEQLRSLINRRTVAEVIDVGKEVQHLNELTGMGQTLGLITIFLILGLSGLGIGAMMVARFDGFKKNIAILRSIGFSIWELSQWLILEGVMLFGGAFLVGFMIDLLMFPIVHMILKAVLPSQTVSIMQSYPVWIAALLATVVACLVPMVFLNLSNLRDSLKGL